MLTSDTSPHENFDFSNGQAQQQQSWESAHPIGKLLANASQYLGGEFLCWMLLGGKRRKNCLGWAVF